MSKGKSVAKIIALILLVVLTTLFILTGFPLSKIAGVYDILPFYQIIDYSQDFAGATKVTLKSISEEEHESSDVTKSFDIIEKRLKAYGISGYELSLVDENINLSLPEKYNAEEVAEYITQTGLLEFSNEENEVVLDGSYLSLATATTYYHDENTVYPAVAVKFNEEGTELLKKVTQENFYKTLNIKLDGMTLMSPTVSQTIEDGQMYVSILDSDLEASRLAGILNSGKLPMSYEAEYFQEVGSKLSEKTIMTLLYITLGVLVTFVFLLLILLRIGGIAPSLALVLTLEAFAVFFAFSSVQLSLINAIGAFACWVIYSLFVVVFLLRVKTEAQKGKSLLIALEASDKSMTKIKYILFCGVFVVGAIMFCMQMKAISGLAYVVIFASVVMFILFLIMKNTFKASCVLFGKNEKAFLGLKK